MGRKKFTEFVSRLLTFNVFFMGLQKSRKSTNSTLRDKRLCQKGFLHQTLRIAIRRTKGISEIAKMNVINVFADRNVR